jgi:hypothetical protein
MIKACSDPVAFVRAAHKDVRDAGYYCLSLEIEIAVEGNVITFVCISKIITLNSEASIDPPTVKPAKGLRLVSAKYEIDGQEIRGQRQVKRGSDDRYSVIFERIRPNVKEVHDDHYWLSPVTPYTVITQHSTAHSSGIGKLAGSRLGLAPNRRLSEAYRNVYKYPCTSFSGQGFRWWVKWNE